MEMRARTGATDILGVYDQASLGTIQSIPFIGRGNVWVEDGFDITSMRIVRGLIYEAIMKTAPGQLHVVGYDENLSGIFAPFSSLTEGQSSIIELIEERADLKKHIGYLSHHARAVQNVIRGLDNSLLEYRSRIKRPVEQYQLIVLSMDLLGAKQTDGTLQQDVIRLLRVGPAVGISFLILDVLPEEREQRLYPTTIKFLSTRNVRPVDPGRNAAWIREIVAKCNEYVGSVKRNGSSNLETVRFQELIASSPARWKKKSVDGLEIKLGKYGNEVQTVVIGDEFNQRHNILITGAVGQGKSNLISVMVHSLCHDYSPEELQLYLLDFKEGVTFKPYANVDQPQYLPHARTIGLESDVEFGVAVFDELHAEYLKRMKLFKKHNVRSLKELRETVSGLVLPRIVVIIDEFQLMFGVGQQATEAANMLENAVRLYRAAGIHFVLSSQTLDGGTQFNTRRDAIFGQVPIRIALKNSLTESYRTLAPDNPAAAYLRPREAIINEEYGVIAHNKKATIAFADERVLRPMRERWWREWMEKCPAPYIYDSEHRAHIHEDVASIDGLSEPSVVLGQRISVANKVVALPFSNDPGCNIAILGAQSKEGETGYGVLQAVAISLAMSASTAAKFYFCEFKASQLNWDNRFPMLFEILRELGHRPESVARDQFEQLLNDLTDTQKQQPTTYVIASNLDNFIPGSGADGAFGMPSYGSNPLVSFAKKGPSRGMHLIGWWVRAANFEGQVSGLDSSDPFNTKVILRAGAREVQRYVGVGEEWKGGDNRALAIDRVELLDNLAFVPYVAMGAKDFDAMSKMAKARLPFDLIPLV